mmetsp:Transcript_29176/g.74450  ORF Transcript_29176/g.74450 Transcript_29176/m.74450 type:complete len:299 (+) Transcript_29176:1038-1934(+)
MSLVAVSTAQLRPLLRLAQHLHQPLLLRPRLGHHVVLPCDERGRRHHDGLDAAAIQPELDAAVIQQVELQVASAADELPVALLLREGQLRARGRDVVPGGQDGVTHVARERGRVKPALLGGHVVVEDATQAAVLVAAGDVKVLVTPLLQLGVQSLLVLVAHLLPLGVEGARVVLVHVERGEVAAATKPGLPRHLEQAHVCAQRGHQRVRRVEHQRHGGGRVGLAALGVNLRAPARAHGLRAGRGQRATHHGRVGRGLLQHAPALQHTRGAPASVCITGVTLPLVTNKFGTTAVQLLCT